MVGPLLEALKIHAYGIELHFEMGKYPHSKGKGRRCTQHVPEALKKVDFSGVSQLRPRHMLLLRMQALQKMSPRCVIFGGGKKGPSIRLLAPPDY